MAVDEVALYTDELVVRLERLLAGELVAVYLTGSRALGEYVPGRSDLDVIAVTRFPLARDRKREVIEALRHESLPCPARKLELVLYAKNAVDHPAAVPRFEINLNTGRDDPLHATFDPADEPRHWFVIDLALVRDHGLPLRGPPPSEVFAPIDRSHVLEALRESLEWHGEAAEARPDDAVLNACRAWRYAAEGSWVGKIAAGEWARTLADDPAVVDAALRRRRGEASRDLDPPKVADLLGRVAALVTREARAARAAAG